MQQRLEFPTASPEADTMEAIIEEVAQCQRCPLGKTRTHPVAGAGDHGARIMFVGEAPGFNEDKTGVPFCGAAGKVLDGLLKSVGIVRNEVYITNILKCRPPQNREPQSNEITACTPYLERQIALVRPEVICTLGNYATVFIFTKYGLRDRIQGISRIHGRAFEAGGLIAGIKVVALYHPAVATYNAGMERVLREDFGVLKGMLQHEGA